MTMSNHKDTAQTLKDYESALGRSKTVIQVTLIYLKFKGFVKSKVFL